MPIAILVNGQFYDASAYKADPVPMALWSETVYEGFRTGVSQGLFTVTTASQNPKTQEWIAEGQWQSADALAKLKSEPKRHESSIPRGIEDDEGPPVLRHSGAKKPLPPQATPSSSASTTNPPLAPSQQKPAASPQTSASASTPPTPTEEDPNIPVLRRGKPTPKPEEPVQAVETPAKSTAKPSTPTATAKPSVQIFAAISDSGGPEARPYTYQATADQEKQFREKMLAVAGDEIAARAKKVAAELGSAPAAHASIHRSRKPSWPPPQFQDIQLRVFDLSDSNEPVLVLTASAQLPQASQNSSKHLEYFIALVEREDINGDFHKIFSDVTDSDHLDVLPRYELIDAVDADGDGRGELLFQQISDDGSTFGIYRVIGNQLYPLFQTAP